MHVRLFATLIVVSSATAVLGSPTVDPMTNPFAYFNVYSLDNIGSSSMSYGSDFQGTAGASGNAYFSGFSLGSPSNSNRYALHAGGSATLSGSYLGNLDIGQNLSLGNVSITGNVQAGGNVSNFGGGSINGNLTAGGNINLNNQLTVSGTRNAGAAVISTVDYGIVSSYFRNTSTAISAMPTTGNYVNAYGGITFTGQGGVNVVDIDAATLSSAWGFTVNAPSMATVYINVINTGHSASLDSTTWNYTGGISAGNVLVNYAQTTALSLSGGNTTNILAPFADVTFSSGQLTGGLVTGNLQGAGQVNMGNFQGLLPSMVPDVNTLALIGMAGVALLRHQPERRRHKSD